MSQRRLTRQQVVDDTGPLLNCAERQMGPSCVQSKKVAHAQPALHSRRAQFAEAGLKIATHTAVQSRRRKTDIRLRASCRISPAICKRPCGCHEYS